MDFKLVARNDDKRGLVIDVMCVNCEKVLESVENGDSFDSESHEGHWDDCPEDTGLRSLIEGRS